LLSIFVSISFSIYPLEKKKKAKLAAQLISQLLFKKGMVGKLGAKASLPLLN